MEKFSFKDVVVLIAGTIITIGIAWVLLTVTGFVPREIGKLFFEGAVVGQRNIVKIKTCLIEWCYISYEKNLGWTKKENLWGVYQNEKLNVPFYQIDKGRKEKENLVSGKVFAPLKSTHQRYRDVFEKIGISINSLNKIKTDKVDISSLKITPTNNKLLIGVAPFAAHKGKEYPLVQIKEVIKELNQDFNIILFGGGKKEELILDEIAGKYINVVNLANKYSLDQEMDVISNLSIMLSMDSANGHIAASLGIKVLSIWGVTHPFAGFGPYGQQDQNNILVDRSKYPKIPTSIYGEKLPKGYENAISSISSAEIISALRTLV